MTTFRTTEAQRAYDDFRSTLDPDACILCNKEPLQKFTYWKIVSNDFPYDRIAARHDMIVPLRHALEYDLTPEEVEELHWLKRELLNGDGEYEYVIEPKSKSIPHHFHLHLIVPLA